ncbi:hypothetical protein [Gracilibacillus thailandensis]|uniref:DUF4054 domain-containing protein n=1 Tax=Gracilibacillus thailandensis TaxID=563735 RepID=A0A6N7QZ22_9BACI|nr:hypothetical protein [Gracilibacillus thailandensis]MRI65159.1 hypothetical protein [Gracilibacillus thailandensis]
MPYITKEYYRTDYQGEPVADDATLDRYIKRASELIDQVTNYALVHLIFDDLPQFIQSQVKKATAAQVEFYVEKDGYLEVDTGTDGVFSSVGIGAFNYQKGGQSSNYSNKQANRISPTVLEHLKPTGLLYRGIGVVHRAY